MESNIPLDQCLQLIFPTIYGNRSKEDTIALQLFNKVIGFLKQDEEMFSKKKERQAIINLLTKSSPEANQNSLHIIFKCEYACAILLKKDNSQRPINIQIIMPEQWGSGTNSWKAQNLDFCEPKQARVIFLPQVPQRSITMDVFSHNFKINLSNEINQIQKQAGDDYDIDYSAKIIEKACRKASVNNYINIYDFKDGEENEQKKKKQIVVSSQSIEMNNSQANTAWYVPEALITTLIKNDKKYIKHAQKLIIGFKAHILENVTSIQAQKNQYNQENVANYKRCLDEIILRYRNNISSQGKQVNRVKDFLPYIKKINDNLKKITKNGLTSKVQDFKEIAGKLPFAEPNKSTLVYPDKIEHVEEEVVLVKIAEYPLRVKERLPFEQLLSIGHQVQTNQLIEKDKWIMLVQKTLFAFTSSMNNDKQIIDFNIHMREIQCEIGLSSLTSLLLKYEEVVRQDLKHFGMGMKGQAESHIQLIKIVAAVIAFQSVKMNRQNKNSNLNNYRIPIDIQSFGKAFISHSYEARKAMKQLNIYYEYRKQRFPIFSLDGKCDSFNTYGRIVAQQTRSAHVWVQNMRNNIDLKKQIILQQIQLQQTKQKLSYAISYLKQSSQFSSLAYIADIAMNKTISVTKQKVMAEFNQNDPWLFAFMQNIPADVLGMMKSLMIAQIEKSQGKIPQRNVFTDHFPQQLLSIKMYSLRPQKEQQYFDSSTVKKQNIQSASNFKDTYIIFQKSIYGTGNIQQNQYQIYQELFHTQEENQRSRLKYNYLLQPIQDAKVRDRQHKLYARQSQKPQQTQIQDFLAIGNVRSAETTQLSILCLNILQKRVISNSYDQTFKLAQEVILQTAGQLSTYNPKVQKQFRQITKLINQFVNVWEFTDVNFCPVFGPLVGYLSKQIIDDQLVTDYEEIKQINKIALRLCIKCIDEYQRGQQDQKINSRLQIQWDQRFICTAAICCFRQITLKLDDQQQIMALSQLIFQLRTCKILSDREQRPEKKRFFETQLLFSIQKTIYYNIEVISEFLIKNKEKIGIIVKKLDPSYSDDVQWTRDNIFSYTGKVQDGGDIYQIDLFLGRIFKNGKQISALDQNIKKNTYFKQIFGQDRQFQVFQSHNRHFVRTKNHVNYQFKIPIGQGLIFFEFSEDGKQIRHIFKQAGTSSKDEQIWILLSRQKLKQSNCFIPKLFLEEYIPWYNQKRSCIIFRKKKFEDIYTAGLIIHLKKGQNHPVLVKSFYIIYHGSFQNQNFDQLCDIETKKYEQIILRNKQTKLQEIQIFKILQRFERPQYVLELKNKKTQQIEYFLHRYQIRFKLQGQTRLSSQTYFGYFLDYSFYDNQNCLFNKFPCLVLQKYSKSATLLNNHKKIVIISDGTVQLSGKIKKHRQADQHIESFKYEIHDFFGDIRGSTRQSLIHLSAIMLSINDNIKISSIEMTPLEYAMYLLNSCLSNRPLTSIQLNKIDNIVKQLNPPQSIVLMTQALWKCSIALQTILPFSKKQRKYSVFQYWNTKLMICRTLYQKKDKKNLINFRQKINYDLLKFLGIKMTSSSNQSSSDSDSSQSIQKESSEWKKVDKYTGQRVIQRINQIQVSFKIFQNECKKMNIWEQKVKPSTKLTKQFSKQIKDLASNPKCNIMTKQMVKQLQQSYETFVDEQNKTQAIAELIKNKKLKQLKQLADQMIKTGKNGINQLEIIIEQIKRQNQNHPDVLTGLRPTFSYVCFTSILCAKNSIRSYFPDLNKTAQKSIQKAMMIWIELKTRIASLERVKIILQAENIDIVAFMRQVTSPRDQVKAKPYWLCFEAQNKVQLWSSQFDTYKNLITSAKTGSFCQLNMGQGKTQVIIPLIILDAIYSRNNGLPRINILSSLMDQARGNFFKFLSVTGFQIPGFQIPFSREVKLNKQNILSIRDVVNSFSNTAYILMTRQSRLSQILRFYETNRINKQKKIKEELEPIIPGKIFDIFDEIDAMMTPVKSYIFSIGDTIELPDAKERLEILRIIIEVFLKNHLKSTLRSKIATTQQTQQDTLAFVQRGQYPPGLRLNFQDVQETIIYEFRRSLTEDIIFNSSIHYFSFVKRLTQTQKADLVEFIIDPFNENIQISDKIPQISRKQVFIMRGAIGYGTFQHCLSMRCGVDYGVPNHYHKKKIAVPYQAADIPSKTSQYQQPDVSTLLSYFAYYTKGLTDNQFDEALKSLLSLSNTSKQLEYQAWFNSLSIQNQQILKIKNANQINYKSKAITIDLSKYFKNNRKVIAFWLNKCIFPKNLKQYKKSICASAWDLADVNHSVGFSGTKDNHWLYSDKLNWKPCQTPAIKGTDGKMLYLITQYTNKIQLIQQNQKIQWQRFIDLALYSQVGCIIDAGALCVGKSLQRQIVPWIAQHPQFNSKYVGISFCDQNGKWKVYDIQSKLYIPRGQSIPDHETFVIFDEARTRGADIKMNSDVVAAISLGPHMTKDKFMQAAGRLRRLGRDQKLIIMATHQIFSSFPQFPKQIEQIKKKLKSINRSQMTNTILSWCCKNSIQSNENLLIQFGNLGWSHIRSKVKKEVYVQQIKSTLKDMYEHNLQKITVSKLNQKNKQQLQKEYLQHRSGIYIVKILDTYGKNVFKQIGSLDDVCERQVQAEKQQQKQQQDILQEMSAIPQKDEAKIQSLMKQLPLSYDSKFMMTQNFIQTTTKQGSNEKAKELAELYFVIYDHTIIKAVTLREASIYIKKNIIENRNQKDNISLLTSLSIKDDFIQKNNLQGALISAKFLSGVQNYTQQQQELLLQILVNNIKNKIQWREDYKKITSLILRKKRIYLKKYIGSTLQKMETKLQNAEGSQETQ